MISTNSVRFSRYLTLISLGIAFGGCATVEPNITPVGATAGMGSVGYDERGRFKSSSIRQRLLNAIDSGQFGVNDYVPLDTNDPGETVLPICAATFAGNVETIRELIRRGAKVNLPCGPNGQRFPLDLMAKDKGMEYFYHDETIAELINNGAKVNVPENQAKLSQYFDRLDAKTAKAREDSRQSAANWQGVLAIAAATADNYAAQSNQRNSQAAASLPLAQLRPPTPSARTTTATPSAPELPKYQPQATLSKLAPISGGSSAGPDSQKLYTFILDGNFRGIGETEAAGCKAAEKDAADWSPTLSDDKRKILNRGTCSCNKGYSNFYGKALECLIPYKMEVTSPNDPNAKYGGPSKVISK